MAKVWKAAEIERMRPAERQALFEASVVVDLDNAPAELVERTRARIAERIDESPSSAGEFTAPRGARLGGILRGPRSPVAFDPWTQR